MIATAVDWLLGMLALPEVGLAAVFVTALVSATLLPMGSEPTLFAVVKSGSGLFWPAIALATIGNTIGGAISYWMGWGAHRVLTDGHDGRWSRWLQRFGPKTMLLAWLPVIGDPLCALAGWLRMPFWASVGYMALGKFLRYLAITTLLLHVPDGFWQRVATWL